MTNLDAQKGCSPLQKRQEKGGVVYYTGEGETSQFRRLTMRSKAVSFDSAKAKTASQKACKLRAERAASLRSDFHPDDEQHWRELAARYGVRLPAYGVPITTAAMERWLHRLGISTEEYMAAQGAGLDGNGSSARLTDFMVRNPTWPLKAWVGLLLEQIDMGYLRRKEAAA